MINLSVHQSKKFELMQCRDPWSNPGWMTGGYTSHVCDGALVEPLKNPKEAQKGPGELMSDAEQILVTAPRVSLTGPG